MRGRLLTMLWLTVVWIALWEDLSVGNALAGVGLAALITLIAPVARSGFVFRPVASLRFFGYFAWKLIEASVIVAWEVVTPSNRVNEGIVAIPMRGVSDALTTLVANAISLTPGTLTLEVHRHPTVLYVHVLHLHDIERVRREVVHLEALAVRALGTSAAIGALAGTGDRADATTPSQATDTIRDDPIRDDTIRDDTIRDERTP